MSQTNFGFLNSQFFHEQYKFLTETRRIIDFIITFVANNPIFQNKTTY